MDIRKYKISEKAQKVIERKVEEFNLRRTVKVTKDEMVEYMIMEFDASTPEERREQVRNKVKSLKKFLDIGNVSIEDAWRDGWATGWMQFQTRKESCKHLKREE